MSKKAPESSNLTSGSVALKIALWGMMIYLTIYTFESPIRYLLYLSRISAVIVARDALILVPITMIGISGLLRRQLHPAFLVFSAFIFVGSIVSILNFHGLFQAALGTKILVNVLFGLVVGAALIAPSKLTARYLLALWLATVIGLVLEKYVVTYPWIGLKTIIGNVQVEISRDWQIADPESKRVGGFTKQSIAAAILLSQVALVTVFQFRSYVVRAAFLMVSIGCIYLTTQKGALIGMVLVSGILLLPVTLRLASLRICAAVAAILVVALPFLTSGLVMAEGRGGVFSASSFAMRINDTWPNSLKWISTAQIFPFGVGVGGIGAGQQLAGSIVQHYPDNMFLLLYAYFGLPSLLMFGLILYAIARSFTIDPEVAMPALAVLTFNLLYGIVVTVMEDQVSALFIGSAIGVLLYASRLPHRRVGVQRHGAVVPV